MRDDGKRFATREIKLGKHEDRRQKQLRRKRERRKKLGKIPHWVYRVIVILMVCVSGMLLWYNKDNLRPENLVEWVQEGVVGMGMGDGYPQSVTGSTVNAGNFRSVNKDVVMVSDTTLSVLNNSGKEIKYAQHSFSQPVMKTAGSHILLYNLGGTGFQVESFSKTLQKDVAKDNILAGAAAPNGRYAPITEKDGYCGYLTVYKSDNTEKFRYWFSEYYPTAVALNHDGSRAAVTGISALDGGLVSCIYLMDLNSEQPVQPFAVYAENMMLDVFYSADGTVSAIGDKLACIIDTSTGNKVNYDYQGMLCTAYTVESGNTALCMAPYENAASCQLVVLNRAGQAAVTADLAGIAKSVSIFGDTVCALSGGRLYFYSIASGQQISVVDAGSDAKAVALRDETSAYVLGISEVRTAGS